MAIELIPGKRLRVTIQPVNAVGNPAPVQAGSVAWSTSDASVLLVSPDPANEQVALVRRGVTGVSVLHVEADADLGSGVTTLTAEAEVAVTEGMATSLGLTSAIEDDV